MASFTVPCPSCEYQVPIKDPKLVGAKVECPKCKYRFKVEEPQGGAAADEGKGAKGKGKKTAEAPVDDAAKKKKKKKIIAIVAGVAAVGILAVVGLLVAGGGKNTPTKGNPNKQPITAANTNPGGTIPGKTGDVEDPGKKDVPIKLEPPPAPTAPLSDKQTTNLFPNDTMSILRIDIARVPHTHALLTHLMEPAIVGMFRSSFGFDKADIGEYYHARVGKARDPFGIIHLRTARTEKEILANMALADKPKKIGVRTLHAFKGNPFIDAIADTLSLGSLLGDFLAAVPPAMASAPGGRIIGVCVYDTQHVLVGDYAVLEAFLSGLDAKGYPKFQSTLDVASAGTLALAQNDLYMSIKPDLKKLLSDLDAEKEQPPSLLYAEEYMQGLYDPKMLKNQYQPIAGVLDPILRNTAYLGANSYKFSETEFRAKIRIVTLGEPVAHDLAKEKLAPNMPLVATVMSYFLRTPVEFRNLIPGMTGVIPGLPPGVAPPGGGAPTLPGGGAPTLPGGGAPTLPGGGAPTLPGGGQPPKTSGPGIPPGAGPGPGIGQPGLGQPGVTPKLDPNAAHIDLGLDGKVIALAVDLRWSKANYETINPVVLKIINGLKARIIMHTSNVPFQGLSAAIKKHVAEKGGFPRGTAERPKDDPARRGMAYPPSTRVSFYPELLPYLNRDYHLSINPQAAWYDPENLPAAEAWVPEFLAPSYPSSSWRATSLTYVPDGRSLGATNYVAIAGVGVDAARYTLPENAKKMGLVGYEWGSKVEEVTDGLANTIFLMQTPPGVPQPWLQGGGATIRGLSEADPMQGFRHTFPNGQQGTYALMGDGSTRFIKGNINPEVLKAMATRAGGELELLAKEIDVEAPRTDKPKEVEVELKPEPKPVDPKTPTPVKPADPTKAVEVKKPVTPPAEVKKPAEPSPAKKDSKLETAPEPREKR